MRFINTLLPLAAVAATTFVAANPINFDLVGGSIDAANGAIDWVNGAKQETGNANIEAEGGMRTMDSWSYTDCGLPGDVIQLKSLKVSPDPPQPGQQLSVTAVAEVLETIQEGAYADVVVKLGLIKLLQKRFDICEEARNANATVQCPVAPGPYEVTQTVDLPREIPHAKFTVGIHGFNADEKDMLCATIVVDFMKGRS